MQRLQQFHQKATKLSYQFYPKCVISEFNKSVSDAAHIIPYQLCQEAGCEELAYDSRNLVTLAKHLHVGFEIANGKIPTFTFKIISKNDDFIKTQVKLPPFNKDSSLPEFLYEGKEIILREESLPYLMTHNIIFNHAWGIKSEKTQLDQTTVVNQKLNTIIDYFKKKMGERYNHYDTDKLEQYLSDKIETSRKRYEAKNPRNRTVKKIKLESSDKILKVRINDKHKLKSRRPFIVEVSGKRTVKGMVQYRVLWSNLQKRGWRFESDIPKSTVKKYEDFIHEHDSDYEDVLSENEGDEESEQEERPRKIQKVKSTKEDDYLPSDDE